MTAEYDFTKLAPVNKNTHHQPPSGTRVLGRTGTPHRLKSGKPSGTPSASKKKRY